MQTQLPGECIDDIEQQCKDKYFNEYGEFDLMIMNSGYIDINLISSEGINSTTKNKRCKQ